jgi:hypothetical protein
MRPLLLALLATVPAITPAGAQTVDVFVDSADRKIVVSARGIHIPAATPYTHDWKETYLQFSWPASVLVRGYRIDMLDSTGALLPRKVLHHAGMANLSRRSLVSPRYERIFAAAQETTPVMLPAKMGIPLVAGQQMSLYYALVNPSAEAVHGATLRVTFTLTPASAQGASRTFPVFLGAHPVSGDSITFDAGPGVTTTSSEFTLPMGGHFRALGGHLHDFASEIRLEDVESNRVIVRLRAEKAADGRIRSVERTVFPWSRKGLRLEADRRYRIVAVYDNPTCRTLPGAMGLMVGPFVPDAGAEWPLVDAADPALARDYMRLTSSVPAEHNHHAIETAAAVSSYVGESGVRTSCAPAIVAQPQTH